MTHLAITIGCTTLLAIAQTTWLVGHVVNKRAITPGETGGER